MVNFEMRAAQAGSAMRTVKQGCSSELPRKLKVCFPFIGEKIGGSKVSALLLIEELQRRGVDVIIVLHRIGHLSEELDRRGVSWAFAPTVRDFSTLSRVGRVLAPLQASLRLRSFIIKNAIDIVHANDLHTNIYWTIPTKIARARMVWHQRQPSASRSGLLSLFADAIPVISEYCTDRLPSYITRRSTLVENPFEQPESDWDKPTARRYVAPLVGIPHDCAVIGFVGDFIERKRPRMIAEIAARVVLRRKNVHFLMIGDPRQEIAVPLRNRIQELGIQKHCHIVGRQFPIVPWILASDMIVCPAVREAFGRVPVESAFLRTPVIAADDGGHREVIAHGQTGLLVTPDDVDAFVEAVILLIDRPEKAASLAIAANTYVKQRYSITSHTDKICTLYRDII